MRPSYAGTVAFAPEHPPLITYGIVQHDASAAARSTRRRLHAFVRYHPLRNRRSKTVAITHTKTEGNIQATMTARNTHAVPVALADDGEDAPPVALSEPW